MCYTACLIWHLSRTNEYLSFNTEQKYSKVCQQQQSHTHTHTHSLLAQHDIHEQTAAAYRAKPGLSTELTQHPCVHLHSFQSNQRGILCARVQTQPHKHTQKRQRHTWAHVGCQAFHSVHTIRACVHSGTRRHKLVVACLKHHLECRCWQRLFEGAWCPLMLQLLLRDIFLM